MEVLRAEGSMMGQRVVFGEIIGSVFRARAPVNVEVTLAHPTVHPVKAYVHGLEAASLDSVIAYAGGTGIVGLKGGGGLGVTNGG
jgi:phosphoribosylcarboxyaminoimidazole (NCAIR) mutase